MFMTLSGYIFAKILSDADIRYLRFLWNRAIRLFPLLSIAFFLDGVISFLEGASIMAIIWKLVSGFILPVWPNGGWSITVELQFYLVLPLFLIAAARSVAFLALILFLAILIRAYFWQVDGEVQYLAYWTLIGRIDQFLLGILVLRTIKSIAIPTTVAVLILLSLLIFNYTFDRMGGFYGMQQYPSESPIWIFYPTIVGLCFATLIAWYDNLPNGRPSVLSQTVAKVGEASFSIYVLHFFFVFWVAEVIDRKLISLDNTYVALCFAFMAFILFVPLARCSFLLVEMPPLKFRKKYIRTKVQQ